MGRPGSMQRWQQFLRWQHGVHIDVHWYRHGHDLSCITLSDSHVPDVGGHGDRNQAMFMKTLDLVGVSVNRIGKVHFPNIQAGKQVSSMRHDHWAVSLGKGHHFSRPHAAALKRFG
jgi:hypothetical protein